MRPPFSADQPYLAVQNWSRPDSVCIMYRKIMTIRLPVTPLFKPASSLAGARPRIALAMRTAFTALLGFLFLASIGGEIVYAASKTGLPLPRFVSLRKDEVNMRTGPGTRYPVDWVFTHRNMPVEIVAEFDAWRKVKDWEGMVGWVHKSMLSGKRWIIVSKGTKQLRRADNAQAPVVAHLEKQVIARLIQCRGAWCEVTLSGLKGWIRRADVWGVYSAEKIR